MPGLNETYYKCIRTELDLKCNTKSSTKYIVQSNVY